MVGHIDLLTVTWPARLGGNVEENLAYARKVLAAIPQRRRIIVCFPESFLFAGVEFTGRTTTLLKYVDEAINALRHDWENRSGYLFLPTVTEDNTGLSLVTVCIGPDGSVLGQSAKRYIWPTSMDMGSFEFGATSRDLNGIFRCGDLRIGVQMCFDVNWPEGWLELSKKGVDLILYPSSYPGGFALRVRAWQAAVPVAASVLGGGPSPLVDLTGEIMALRSSAENSLPYPLNLNRAIVHLDHADHGLKRLVKAVPEILIRRLRDDNVVLIEAPADGPPISSLLSAAGLTSEANYLAAAAIANRRVKE